MTPIYTFKNYKDYLNAILSERDKLERGSRKALATAVNCQSAYISHVLNGENHFSLEQAIEASRFFRHSDEERQFFLLLVQHDRAGTPTLRKYFGDQLAALQNQRRLVQNRLRTETLLQPEEQARYYSHWSISAIHMLLMIREFQTPDAVAQRLKIGLDQAEQAFRFLESCGLVHFATKKTSVRFNLLHLPATSPLIIQHHSTWRLHAVEKMATSGKDQLHYSGALALSREDFQKIRTLFLDVLERTREIAKESVEEDVFALGLDLFPV